MGNVIFRRKKVVTEELDEIQQKAQLLEEAINKTVNSKHSMRWLCSLTLFVLTGIGISMVLFYVSDKRRRTLYSVLASFAGLTLIYLTNRLMNAYYEWCIGKKRRTFLEMTKRKLAILEQVKETETFKVAKEILEKYGDPAALPSEPMHHSSRRVDAEQRLNSPRSCEQPQRPARGGFKVAEGHMQKETPMTAATADLAKSPSNSIFPVDRVDQRGAPRQEPQQRRLPPRPFLGQNRSLIERFVDFLLADGPNYRYALVCSSCYAHNGMARDDEYDHFSYYCWVCGAFNAARKPHQAQLQLRSQLRPPQRTGISPKIGSLKLQTVQSPIIRTRSESSTSVRSSDHQANVSNTHFFLISIMGKGK
ncbi:unnamed protein product [Anisakis simplex]|uniref:Endoplasmic reticulum junction formation protein lunapark n=1 Tax=Anisakis simplex TaxID=6269 RepID=A0A0M3JQS0_ANISI|nr:unnamed protein product [Anisakis simplex]